MTNKHFPKVFVIREEGHVMGKLWLATAGALALGAAPISAADLGVPYAPTPVIASVYDWSGLYIGLNGGGGQSHNCWDLVYFGGPVSPTPEGCHNATGGTIGGQVGYRWQAASWVLGIEAQGNWATFEGSNLTLLTDMFGDVRNSSRIDGFGLFTGQVGYAWDNFLLYAKGGVAVVSNRFKNADMGDPLYGTAEETRWGGTVGGGIEYGFAANWSVAFEYNHLFMGNKVMHQFEPDGTYDGADNVSQGIDVGTARLNYHF